MSLNSHKIAKDVGAGLASIGVRAYLVKSAAANAADPFSKPGAETEYPVTVVYGDWSKGEIDGTLIKQSDRKAMLSVPSLNGQIPEVGDGYRLSPGGNTLRIVAPLKVLAPAGEPLLYVLNGRG